MENFVLKINVKTQTNWTNFQENVILNLSEEETESLSSSRISKEYISGINCFLSKEKIIYRKMLWCFQRTNYFNLITCSKE